jgi:hypothetical protein
VNVLKKTSVIEGKVYERGGSYSTYGDIQTANDYLTDELLEFEGMTVRVTIETIE